MLLLVQFSILLEASLGVTVAVSVCVVLSAEKVSDVLLRETPVTRMGADTVTEHVALMLLPSVALAVIVAVPLPFDVTTPLLLTVATLVLLLVQVSFLLAALLGVTVAVSVCVVLSAVKVSEVLLREMPSTGIVTVTVHVALMLLPSLALAVIVAVPLPFAVTTPRLLMRLVTVATSGLLLVHSRFLLAALLGVTVAVSVSLLSMAEKFSEVLLREIPTTGMPTVTVHVALVLLPSVALAVIVAVPLPFDVTTPLLLTVATLLLLLVHSRFLLAALLGVTVAVSVCVVLSAEKVSDVLLRKTPAAGMGVDTVTVHVALLLLPSVALAVIVAVPLPFDVTTPLLLTVATLVLLLVQVSVLLAALLGVTIAVSVCVVLSAEKESDVILRETPVTRMGVDTVTEHVALLLLPSVVVAVMVAVP